MTKQLTNKETLALLREKDNFLIINHRRPDGDAVGSAAGLCLALRQLGKTAYIWKNPQTTERFLPYLRDMERDIVPEGATLVSVDMATEGLLPINGEQFRGKILLSIDHHPSNDGYATYTNVQPQCAACGELLLELLQELGTVTCEMAEALYLAICTDTGCFQYSNVTEHTLSSAATLKGIGVDTYAINKRMFGTKSISRLRLEAALTESIQFFADGQVAVTVVTLEMQEKLQASEDDMDSIAGFPRAVEGVEIGVMIRQLPEGGSKISLRTGENTNASEICAILGGGGHRAAAGATVSGDVQEAQRDILNAVAQTGVVL